MAIFRTSDDTFRWVVGGLATTIVLLVTYFFTTITAQVAVLTNAQPATEQRIALMEQGYATRTLQLNRIEDNLHWLVQRELDKADALRTTLVTQATDRAAVKEAIRVAAEKVAAALKLEADQAILKAKQAADKAALEKRWWQ